jgi:hypothetical protein
MLAFFSCTRSGISLQKIFAVAAILYLSQLLQDGAGIFSQPAYTSP